MRESFPRDLSSETKEDLAQALECECWEEVPDVVQNNLRTPNVDLETFLDKRK
jgi:hypothetical protein